MCEPKRFCLGKFSKAATRPPLFIGKAPEPRLGKRFIGVQLNWRMTVPKKVQIKFALKTPTQLAKRLGVSKARLERILAIAGGDNSRKNDRRSEHVAFKSKDKLSS